MQAYILPFLAIYMNLGFGSKFLFFTLIRVFGGLFGIHNLKFSGHNIIGRPGWDTKGKLTLPVREKLPLGAILASRVNFHFSSIDCEISWTVSGAKDESVMLPEIFIISGE